MQLLAVYKGKNQKLTKWLDEKIKENESLREKYDIQLKETIEKVRKENTFIREDHNMEIDKLKQMLVHRENLHRLHVEEMLETSKKKYEEREQSMQKMWKLEEAHMKEEIKIIETSHRQTEALLRDELYSLTRSHSMLQATLQQKDAHLQHIFQENQHIKQTFGVPNISFFAFHPQQH